tara:strand:+ start:180 stop:560 length:381 start_codon:yes stop_codon:yes gene_type:complete
MTTFTNPILRELRNQLNAVLNSNGIDGYTFELGNCRYDGGEANFKLKVLINGAETSEEKHLRQMAQLSDLDTTKVATLQGMKVSLVGYRAKARKRPWLIQDLTTAKQYVLDDYQAKRLFGTVAEVS